MEKSYTALAQLLNCHPDEIAVVTSATAAWYQVQCVLLTENALMFKKLVLIPNCPYLEMPLLQ